MSISHILNYVFLFEFYRSLVSPSFFLLNNFLINYVFSLKPYYTFLPLLLLIS